MLAQTYATVKDSGRLSSRGAMRFAGPASRC